MKKWFCILTIGFSIFLLFLAAAVPAEAQASFAADASYPVTNPFDPLAMAGVLINGHYAYCVDVHSPWPDKDGIAYTQNTDLGELTAEQQEQLARTMDAGYPRDCYGLSALEPNAQYRGTYTQWAVWAVLGSEMYRSYVGAGGTYAFSFTAIQISQV